MLRLQFYVLLISFKQKALGFQLRNIRSLESYSGTRGAIMIF